MKKSIALSVICFLLLFCQFCHFAEAGVDLLVVFRLVGDQARRAVFDAIFEILEITAALVAQSVQRAIAEDAIKVLAVRALMAGEIFTLAVLEIAIMFHVRSLPWDRR